MRSPDFSTIGALNAQGIGPDWMLILGGVTRSGHRRAQRVADQALKSGLDVVWFDGLVDTDPTTGVGPEESGVSPRLVVVEFGGKLEETLSGRLRAGDGLRTSSMGRQVWRVLRKVGGILQPRACWRVVQSEVRRLSEQTDPIAIVYTDDQAITSAWYASRIWKNASVATDLPPSSS